MVHIDEVGRANKPTTLNDNSAWNGVLNAQSH